VPSGEGPRYTTHWPEPMRADAPEPVAGPLPSPALVSRPAEQGSPAHWQTDAGHLEGHVVASGPAVPDARADAPHQPWRPGEAPAPGGMSSLDDILEALADQLELALLRAYGTSGG